MASRDGIRFEKHSRRTHSENFSAAGFDGHGISKNPCGGRCLKISTGRTKSYGEIAAAIGQAESRPRGGRRVRGESGSGFGSVHRVLAANKKLGGFSGGLDWKRKLLAQEGIKF